MIYKCVDQAGAARSDALRDMGDRMLLLPFGAPRSFHPGGVNVAFVDGHVAFLPDDVNEIAMAFLVSANDTHVIDRNSIPGL